MVTTILSPHLDDAVLSCWHVLIQPAAVTVLNVFTSAPARRRPIAWWDQLTGATDSAQRMRERIREDREALALAGRTAAHLAFLDEQYRDAPQALGPLVQAITVRLAPGALLYAPAALGDHGDHAVVRAAALELRRIGHRVRLYADLPHATMHGWPAWVTGARSSPSPDLAAALWDRSLAGTGVPPAAMARTAHRLDRDGRAAKLRAVRAYRTQLRGLAELAGRSLMDPETLGYEVIWELPSAERAQAPAEAVA